MDLKSCVTSLAISATSGSSESLALSAVIIDRFVCSIAGEPPAKLEALRELRQAHAELRLDGQTALAVQALIDDKMSALMAQEIAPLTQNDDAAATSVQP